MLKSAAHSNGMDYRSRNSWSRLVFDLVSTTESETLDYWQAPAQRHFNGSRRSEDARVANGYYRGKFDLVIGPTPNQIEYVFKTACFGYVLFCRD